MKYLTFITTPVKLFPDTSLFPRCVLPAAARVALLLSPGGTEIPEKKSFSIFTLSKRVQIGEFKKKKSVYSSYTTFLKFFCFFFCQ